MQQIFKVVFLVFISSSIFAQSTYIPLGNPAYEIVDRFDIKYGKVLPAAFTATRPFSRIQVANLVKH